MTAWATTKGGATNPPLMPTTTVHQTTVVQPITRRMADADSSQTRAAESKPAQDGDTGGRKKRVRMNKERRRELRQQRRQLWRSAHASKRTGWCARHNKCLFITINLVFVVRAAAAVAVAVLAPLSHTEQCATVDGLYSYRNGGVWHGKCVG